MTSSPRRPASAISAWLVAPQSTVMMTVAPTACGPVERRDREAVALVEPARHVRLDGQPVALERLDHDRQPGQPVRVEVAEHEHPLALVAREREASQQDVDVGEERRVVEPVEGLAEERVDGGGRRGHRGRRAGRPRGRRGHAWPRPRKRPPGPRRGPGAPIGSAARARPSVCHPSLHRGFDGRLHRSGQETERRVRGARVGATRPCRRSSQRCQSTRSGLATKIEE